MAIEHINPPELMKPAGYSHMVAASGGKTVYLAGQGPYDGNAELVGASDLRAQTKQTVSNLLVALKAAGAVPEDLVKLNIYIVGLDSTALRSFLDGVMDATDGEGLPVTASTMVGVERLAWDGMLVEIEGIAVVA